MGEMGEMGEMGRGRKEGVEMEKEEEGCGRRGEG